jgi:uncharacterized protein (TIGR02246 family)
LSICGVVRRRRNGATTLGLHVDEGISAMSITATITTTETAAVRELLAKLYAAWAAGDADAFADLYTDDATVVMPGVFHHGREAVRRYMAAGFAGPLRGSRGVDEPQQIRILGDVAILVSKAGILMSGEAELPSERERFATWVLCKQDGDWRVAAYANAAAH